MIFRGVGPNRIMLWGVLAVCCVWGVAQAQEIELAVDIFPGFEESSPAWITQIGSEILLSAAGGEIDDRPDQELYRSDGSEAGTVLVRDINPTGPSHPVYLRPLGDEFLFSAHHRDIGQELWLTDGSPAGTRPLIDIEPGVGGSYPGNFTELGERILFAAATGGVSNLWLTDGTSAGTWRVSSSEVDGKRLTGSEAMPVLDGVALYAGRDEATGTELWRSDGTEGGTWRVADIAPGTESSSPFDFALAGDVVYFKADDGVSGQELWRTDGTAAGTRQVADICPGDCSAFSFFLGDPPHYEESSGLVFFSAEDSYADRELWVSDGTAAGTRLLEICPGNCEADPVDFVSLNGVVYFAARDEQFDLDTLWRSDGSAAGTYSILGDRPGEPTIPRQMVAVNGLLLFHAWDDVHGRELWVSDGFRSGSALAADISAGAGSAFVDHHAINIGGTDDNVFYLAADDGRLGKELYSLTLPPAIAVSGGCPDGLTLELAGGGPREELQVFTGSGPGSSTIQQGGCAGVELSLAEARLVGVATLDENGEYSLAGNLPAGACGAPLQVVGNTRCLPSRIALLPSPEGPDAAAR